MKKTLLVAVSLVLMAGVYGEELSLFWSFDSGSGMWTVATSENGERIASGSWDHNVYFFDSRGNMLWEYKTDGSVWTVASSADSSFIAVGSEDKNVYLLDSSGSLVWKQPIDGIIWDVAISREGDRVAGGSFNDNVYYFKDGELAWEYATEDDVLSVAMSGDGERVAVGSWDKNIYFFDSTGTLLWKYTGEGIIGAVDLSRDGRLVVAGSNDNRFYVFKSDGTPLSKFRLADDILSVDISADGTYAAAGSRDGGIYIFQLPPDESASLIGKYKAKDEVWSVSLSEDGSRVVAGSLDNNVYVLDNQGKLVGSFETGSRVTSVAITADGKRVTAGSYDNRVYFLDAESLGLPEVKIPELIVTREVSPESLTEGEYATIRIDIQNVGPGDAADVEIIDFPPEGLTVVGGDTEWSGELNPGESASVSYTVLAFETEKTAVYELPKLDITYKDSAGEIYHAFSDPIDITVEYVAPPVTPEVTKAPEPEIPPVVVEEKGLLESPWFSLVLIALILALLVWFVRRRIARRPLRVYRPERVELLKRFRTKAREDLMPDLAPIIQARKEDLKHLTTKARKDLTPDLAPILRARKEDLSLFAMKILSMVTRKKGYKEKNVALLRDLKKEVGG